MAQEAGMANETRVDGRTRLAQYLAEQPRSRRTFDKVMKVLELAGLAFIAGYLAWAIYGSINWNVPENIAAVWLCFPLTFSILAILVGVHAAGLKAFFPVIVPGGPQNFITGSKAVATGIGFAVSVLLVGVFWGAFAWGFLTDNLALLEPLVDFLGVVVGLGIAMAVASSLYKHFFRRR
jgi:hypothetical protein